jgi:hypothetical protein
VRACSMFYTQGQNRDLERYARRRSYKNNELLLTALTRARS